MPHSVVYYKWLLDVIFYINHRPLQNLPLPKTVFYFYTIVYKSKTESIFKVTIALKCTIMK